MAVSMSSATHGFFRALAGTGRLLEFQRYYGLSFLQAIRCARACERLARTEWRRFDRRQYGEQS
jgi:hypothetical protein